MTLSAADRVLSFVSRRLLALPDRAKRALAGGGRVRIEGNELDPNLQLMLAIAARVRPPFMGAGPIAHARRESDRGALLVAPPPRDVDVRGRRVPGPAGELDARVYARRDLGAAAPALVFFHGGGWTLGSLEASDTLCRIIADDARCVVVSVDYRLAPEHPWPAAADDAFAAFSWVHANAKELRVDAARIGVGGDSAGGNLSAVVCLDARDAGGPAPKAQLLIYPATDLRRSMPSHRTFADGFLLTKRDMDWFVDNYVPGGGERLDHPRVSPYKAPDLTGLPPALVLTAGFDPLRDEGRAYADRMEAAGVRVRYRLHASMIHGFASLTGVIPAAHDAVVEATTWLREAL